MKNLYRNLMLSLAFGVAVNANAGVFTTDMDNSFPVAIDDVSSATSIITVADHGIMTDLNIVLNNVSHSWNEDLVISISHAGTTAVLSNRNGGSGGADYISTLFDDDALMSITSGIAYAPYTGSFAPEELLSAFNGMDIFGDWLLTVTDMEIGDTGAINSWGIRAVSVPEPTSMILLSLGLLGLGARRLRVQRSK